MDISKFNFDHLTVKYGPESVQHDPEYIKEGTGAKANRRIFYSVPLDSFERQQIKELETALIERDIRMLPDWTERETLKYIYATKFDHEKAIERIKKCIEWRNNPISRTVTRDVLRLFETGALYLYGRDKQYRPIIVFDFGKVDFNTIKGEDFNVAITVLLDIAIRYCYYPGKVEHNIIIIDTRKLSLTSLPISTMKNWVEIGDACFPSNLFKTYVVGPPFLIRMSWKIIENLLQKGTAEKIELLAVDELDKIQTIIDPSQLEQKFGGNAPDLTTFWPPVASYNNALTVTGSFQSLNGSFNQGPSFGNINKPQTYSMTDHYQSNIRHYDNNQYRSTFEVPRMNERFTSEPRIEPSGHIVDSSGLGTNHRYTSASRIEATGFHDTYQTGSKHIFDTRPGRASQGANHSPMRVKEKDEPVVRGIMDSPSYNRYGQHEAVKKSAAPPVFTSVRNEMLDNLGDDRTKEKRLDERLDKQFGLETSHRYVPAHKANRGYSEESTYEATPSSKTGSNQDLMNMILKEDRILRGRLLTEPDTAQIPSESAGVQARITERESSPVRLKQYVDLANSPKRDQFRTSTDYNLYQTHATFAAPNSSTESYKKSVRAPIPEEASFERSAHRTFTAGTPYSPQRTDTIGRPIEEWPQKKLRELPRPGTEEDDSDDDGVFCGICISTKGSQAKKAANY